ncbi:toxin-antitoxin system YwqK family antitoxin [Tenacibaculum ovolyticum]|uniref:toxin-antitoxin system YwqK family antitoxin n=1 Tax=Tenacibaculum ovolyticum TaxID=104270 RepID=UPI0007EC478E|nr:hypothetical protein [Tenacibaculum ovolyticum]
MNKIEKKYFIFLLIIFSSCKDDIFNKKFRNENYVFYQEDGKVGEWLKVNSNLEIKLPKSHSTYFFPNGNRYAELEVIDSFPNRIIKYFDKENNKLNLINKYKSDSLINEIYQDGYNYQYFSNLGHLKSEGMIQNNLFQGIWKFYRRDGKTTKQIVEYKNDTLNGIREDYWGNKNLKTKTVNIKGKLNGKTIHYHQNGQIEEIKYLKDGKTHGLLNEYYENGKIKSKCNYWLGKKKDTCKFYYKNGNLRKLVVIKLDTISSSSTKQIFDYYETGEFKSIFKSKDSTITGKMKVYYKNGNISHKYNLKNNVIADKIISYYETGGVKTIGFVKNNNLDKYVEHFNKKGKLLKTIIVKNGIAIDSIIP